MPPKTDAFLALRKSDRLEALTVAAAQTGRPAHLLEKDVWVVWTLSQLFGAPFGEYLVFKGGTSLSKAYGLIDRFSEDIDLTFDVREIVRDLTGDTDGIPPSKSQAAKWRKVIEGRLPEWVKTQALPLVTEAASREKLDIECTQNGTDLILKYQAASSGTGYVKPEVKVEFGARSTGEPHSDRSITCDAAGALPSLAFPMAIIRTMNAERTFWEKATAIHVYCLAGKARGRASFARHWFDLAKLNAAGVADRAFADRAFADRAFADRAFADKELADAVATHKHLFFGEKDATGQAIDYQAAVDGALVLLPDGEIADRVRDDFTAMSADGLLGSDAMSFDELMAIASDLQNRYRKLRTPLSTIPPNSGDLGGST